MSDLVVLNRLLAANVFLVGMNFCVREDAQGYDLILSVCASEDEFESGCVIRFFDVDGFAVSGVGGGLVQFMLMSVKRLDSGMDRVRYKFEELEEGKLFFFFKSYEVLAA